MERFSAVPARPASGSGIGPREYGACFLALAVGAVAAAAGPQWGPLAVGGALLLGLLATWAWRRLDAAVAAFAFLIPLQVRLNLPGDWSLAAGFIVITGLGAIFLYRQLVSAAAGEAVESVGVPGAPGRTCLDWQLPVLLFAGAAVMSLWVAIDLGEAGRRLLYLLWFLLLFWLVPRCVRSEAALDRVLRATMAAATIAALIGLVQFVLQFVVGTFPLLYFWIGFITPVLEGERVAASYQSYSTNWVLPMGGQSIMRAIGPFSGPPDAAQYLAVCLPLLGARLLMRPQIRLRDLVAPGILLLFLVLTFSRQAWVGLLFALPAMYLGSVAVRSGRLRQRLGYLIAGGAVSLALVLAVGSVDSSGPAGSVAERLRSIGDRSDLSNQDRFMTWSGALGRAEEYPVLGLGVGNYAAVIGDRHGSYSHNTYLDVLVETGPLGLLGLLGILGWGGYSAWDVVRRARTPLLQAVGIGSLGAMVALSVIFFFDDAFYIPRAGQAFWLLLGLIAAARQIVPAAGQEGAGERTRSAEPFAMPIV
jgi:O-antigen ligase